MELNRQEVIDRYISKVNQKLRMTPVVQDKWQRANSVREGV